MRIIQVDIIELNVPKLRPLKISAGVVSEIKNVFVRIEVNEGLIGWGEASPFPLITGDSQQSNIATARNMASILIGKDPRSIEARMTELNAQTTGDTSIKSAFNVALYDLTSQSAGLPLYRFLGGEKRRLITDRTISLWTTLEETARVSEELREANFQEVKIKTGRIGLKDIDHLRVAREILGESTLIRIDSNGGWNYSEALSNLDIMTEFNIQYCEQPLPAWNDIGHAELRAKVNLPICLDESLFDDKDAMRLIKGRATDYMNIKLGKSGGISTALRINAVAEAAGNTCMLGCFLESRLGLTAAAHLAMARPNIQFLDLDSARGFSFDPIVGGADFGYDSGGEIILEETPGLGCSLDLAAADIVHSAT